MNKRFFIMKLDSGGKVLWTNDFGNTGKGAALSVQPGDDGGCIAAGYKNNRPLIRELDAEGNLLWEWGGNKKIDLFLDLKKARDGGLIVSGYYKYEGVVIKFDADRRLQWRYTVGIKKKKNNRRVQAILEMENGNILALGLVEREEKIHKKRLPVHNYWISEITPRGKELWIKEYGDKCMFEKVRRIIQTPDGGYAVVGTLSMEWMHFNIGKYKYSKTGYMAKLDKNFQLEWSRLYAGETVANYLTGIANHSEGGFLLCGTMFLDVWVIKVPEDGSCPDCKYDFLLDEYIENSEEIQMIKAGKSFYYLK